MTRQRFNSLDEALAALRRLEAAGSIELAAPITPHQMLIHLCQSIECSLRGYPAMKPAWLRATVGRLVAGRFLRRGEMKHDHGAPVPGEPAISADGDLGKAWARLHAAIAAFQAASDPLPPHFFFGALTKAEYERIHAMHIADHLSAVRGA